MRKLLVIGVLAAMTVAAAGCGKISGPRFWWDDRNQERIAEGYTLPANPGAPADHGIEYESSSPVGDDLTEDNLRDYRTNLDQEEERRKSESSLLDF